MKKARTHAIKQSYDLNIRWLATTLVVLTICAYATQAPAQQTPRYGYDRPSNEMDFDLPPLPTLEESTPSANKEDIEAEMERFFSDVPIIDEPELLPETTGEPVQKEVTVTEEEVEVKPKKKRRYLPRDIVRFRHTTNVPFAFKSVRLPDSIYKKAYDKPNIHLPIAEYEKDRHLAVVHSASKGKVAHMRALKLAKTPMDVHDDAGTPPLIAAAQHNQLTAVHWLATQGVGLDQMDAHGLSALHYAALHGNTDMVETLLAYGADPNLADTRGYTPLLYAARSGSAKTVKKLVELGAYLHIRARNGDTALHMAVLSGRPEVSQLLRQYGLNAHQANANGFTPGMYEF